MREYTVRVLNRTYRITASDRYHAASQGVRLYLESYPEMYTFTALMDIVSARLVHPEVPGRKPVMAL